MTSKWPLIAFSSLFLMSLAPAQQRPAVVPTQNQRFQLLGAEVTEQAADGVDDVVVHEVFMLDSQTGRVWKFHSSLVLNGNGKNGPGFIPEKLVEVPIEQ